MHSFSATKRQKSVREDELVELSVEVESFHEELGVLVGVKVDELCTALLVGEVGCECGDGSLLDSLWFGFIREWHLDLVDFAMSNLFFCVYYPFVFDFEILYVSACSDILYSLNKLPGVANWSWNSQSSFRVLFHKELGGKLSKVSYLGDHRIYLYFF